MFDYCKNNHELKPGNVNSRGRCKRCNCDYQKAHRDRVKAKLAEFERLSAGPRVPGQV